MSATAPYYSIPVSGGADFLYSPDSEMTLLMRGEAASCAGPRRDSGVCRVITALVKARPLGMVNECHEAGALFLCTREWRWLEHRLTPVRRQLMRNLWREALLQRTPVLLQGNCPTLKARFRCLRALIRLYLTHLVAFIDHPKRGRFLTSQIAWIASCVFAGN